MKDIEIEATCALSERLKADIESIARIVTERYVAAGSPLSWHLLREIEQETIWDLGLLSRWPVELVTEFASRYSMPPLDGVIESGAARSLGGLPGFICDVFDRAKTSPNTRTG